MQRILSRTMNRHRRGLSLLEVVLALGIFLGTYLVISEIVRRGAKAGREALAQNAAVLRAERVMNELVAGSLPFQNSSGNTFEDDKTWSWSSEIADGPHVDLKQITVSVKRTEGNLVTGEYSLVRWTRDPQLYLDAAAASSSTTSSSTTTATP